MTPWSSSDTGVSPPPSSPAHSVVELPGFRSSDLYYDPRNTPGPSRYVRAPLGTPGAAGAIAKSADGLRCGTTSNDSIKVIRITDPSLPSNTSSDRLPRRPWKSLACGPGNVTVHEEAHTRLPANVASTDLGWGYGKYASKIVVTCANGDLIMVDVSRSGMKIERTWKEHTRAVNAIGFTPLLNNYFATASLDGYVKLWDFRNPTESSISLGHKSPVRALTFCPLSSSPFHAVVALESGALYKWDTRKGNLGLVDRVNLAHRGPVLGMEWIGNGIDPDSRGWLCTGGMDRTVKVWDMSVPLLSQTPIHTLHTTERVKRVTWRPGHDCEIAVVPQTSMISPAGTSANTEDLGFLAEADRIEIWDVRRGWIPKYILENGEGAVSDVVWGDGGALWAFYKNGSFVQHDLRDCVRPLDTLARNSISWDVTGSISYAIDESTSHEIPYDDIKPSTLQQFSGRGILDKTPSEPDYIPTTQTAATVSLSALDIPTFVRLARGYMLECNTVITASRSCLVNAEIAREAGQYRASQTWLVLNSVLQNMGRSHVGDYSIIPASPNVYVDAMNPPVRPSTHIGGRAHSTSSAATSTQLHIQMHPESRIRPSVSRKTSGVINNKGSRWSDPRGRGTGHTREVSLSRSNSSRRVGDGALDDESDSSDGNITPSNVTPYGSPGHDEENTVASQKSITSGSATYGSVAPAIEWLTNDMPAPSSRDVDEQALVRKHRHTLPSISSRAPVGDLSDDGGSLADDNYDSSSSSGEESTTGALAPPSSPNDTRFLSLSRPRIVKQDSHSSIKTAVPRRFGGGDRVISGDGDGASTNSENEINRKRDLDSKNDNFSDNETGISRSRFMSFQSQGSQNSETCGTSRRQSPASKLLQPSTELQQQQEYSPIDPSRNHHTKKATSFEGSNGKRPKLCNNPFDTEIIEQQEAQLQDIGTSALQEAFRYYADLGDVQMCFTLATVAPMLLFPNNEKENLDFLSTSYAELLSRLRLYTSAAYVRKYGLSASLKVNTQLNTVNYASCGGCRKALLNTRQSPINQPVDSITTTIQSRTPAEDSKLILDDYADTGNKINNQPGVFGYCQNCRCWAARCSICRLPVIGLHFLCSVCSHGGHQKCYEEYYLRRPMIIRSDQGTFGSPGNLGWGLSAGLKPRLGSSRASTLVTQDSNSWRTSMASEESGDLVSQESDPIEDVSWNETKERDATTDGSIGSIQGLSSKWRENSRDKEYIGERSSDLHADIKRKLMAHPCAAGCGHMCWAATRNL
ncbi:hypothetical protein FRC03_005238 [Tulasnella sp. 419]|nr:hypothetical protein FRC03_005238 [Tulasnella sp. 419]